MIACTAKRDCWNRSSHRLALAEVAGEGSRQRHEKARLLTEDRDANAGASDRYARSTREMAAVDVGWEGAARKRASGEQWAGRPGAGLTGWVEARKWAVKLLVSKERPKREGPALLLPDPSLPERLG